MNQLLTMMAAAQHGVFTRADAHTCGYDDVGLRRLVAAGECARLTRGVYGLPTPRPSPEDRHRQLVRGLLLRFAGRVAASHHSALLLHGLPTYGVDLSRAQLTRLDEAHGARHPEHHLHRAHRRAAPTEVEGWAALPIAQALVQTATVSTSIPAIVSADAALRRKLVTEEELAAAVTQAYRWPGSRSARTMLRFVDGRSESVGETRLRLELAIQKIPVIPQFTISDAGEVVARVDLRVRNAAVLVEFDGMVKYRGGDGPAVLEAEKRREDRLRRLGWEVERVIWPELDHPSLIGVRVRQACARAERNGHPPAPPG